MMQGHRVDAKPHELERGDYSNVFDNTWYARTPNGLLANLANHKVVEHEDRTITVSPSIFVNQRKTPNWHGYLERGVWREC